MRGARWRKVRADLTRNRLRSGLAIVSLAVGTTAVGAMVVAGQTVDESFSSGFAAANPPSAVLVTEPFTPELVGEVADHPSVAQAEGRRLHHVQATGPRDPAPVGVELVAMPDFADNQVARIDPTAGAWPPAPGDIVLERASAAELGAELGDVVTIHGGGRAAHALPVTGVALDAYEVAPMLGGPVRGYVHLDTMAELTGSHELNALYLRSAGQPTSQEVALQTADAVRADVLGPAGVAVERSVVDDPGVHRADNALSFLVLAMQLLSVLAFLIAVALVVNTVAALLAQQRSQVGVMKAVGATTRQLTAQYLAYVALLSAVALLVSVPASLVLGRTIAGFVANLANIDLVPMAVPFTAIGLQVAVATVLPLIAVVLTVRRRTGITVRDTITDRGLAGAARAVHVALPFSRPQMLAYRNAVRTPARLVLTVLTVALSGAVIVGVMSTGSGLGRVSDQVAGYRGYDVGMTLAEPVPVPDAAAVLAGDPAVASVEGWVTGQGLRERPDGTTGSAVDLVGAPPSSASLRPTLLDGRWLDTTDEHGIVINTHLADAETDLAVGDPLVLETAGRPQQWTVVGIASTTLVGPVAYTSSSDLAVATGHPGTTDLLAVRLTEGAEQTEAAERLGALARGAGLPVAQVETHEQIRAATDGLFDIAVALLLVVGIVLAVVAVIGVAGTITLGVVEQTREIGVLRTIGATTWAVRRLLLAQGLAVAAVGGVVGVALSVPVMLLLGSAIQGTLISAEFPMALSWAGVGLWMAVALVIGALGATQPARIASRLTVRDTLAYE